MSTQSRKNQAVAKKGRTTPKHGGGTWKELERVKNAEWSREFTIRDRERAARKREWLARMAMQEQAPTPAEYSYARISI